MGQDTPLAPRTDRYEHEMPFGPKILPEKGVLFRLWAPSARSVEVCLENSHGSQTLHTMRRLPAGWFETLISSAGPGTLYRFRIDKKLLVPDPASRAQHQDVHGPSVVVDPKDFAWRGDWRGRPWEEAVIYEIHPGTFTPGGTFSDISERLPHLVDLGVTTMELMPVADFPGARSWGYDGVLIFAPDKTYGSPDDLKQLIQSAHDLGLMVLLDVVYNHFGPEGNYLHVYAREAFFTDRHQTPWGAAINLCGANSRAVRDFFIHNALYWLEEYRFDGLRLDAANAVFDDSRPDIFEEIAQAVRTGPGKNRHIHLVLENDDNAARYLARDADGAPAQFTAQWNDDLHHACHVLLTGEKDGYYQDYSDTPIRHFGRCLAEGFAYQGEPSPFRGQKPRGETSSHLPPQAFVAFLQNHDQIGNRAFGERLVSLTTEKLLHLAVAAVLLAPGTPLLFMGEEFGATTPFLFFCDFGPELRGKIAAGRLREFSSFPKFSNPAVRASIPDPEEGGTYRQSRLDWSECKSEKGGRFLELYKALLALRRRHISPRLAGIRHNLAACRILGPQALQAHWTLGDGSRLRLLLNLSPEQISLDSPLPGRMIFEEPSGAAAMDVPAAPPQSVIWSLEEWMEPSEDPQDQTDGEEQMAGDVLQRFCDMHGIAPNRPDAQGNRIPLTTEARQCIRETFGLNLQSGSDYVDLLEIIAWRQNEPLRPRMVIPENSRVLRIKARLPQWVLTAPLHWSLKQDDGETLKGQLDLANAPMTQCLKTGGERFVAVDLTIPLSLSCGYHGLALHAGDAKRRFDATCTIISTPKKCYVPPGLQDNNRIWGISGDLGTLRSDRNWGLGDFSDLQSLMSWAAQQGAGAVAMAPFQPIAPAASECEARHESFTFVNPLHLGLEEMEDFHESPEAARHCLEPTVRVRLACLRDVEDIDFSEVARVKTTIFEICWRHFHENHLDPDSERGRAFRTFQDAGAARLRAWAVFETLREHFAENGLGAHWHEWPDEFREAHDVLDCDWVRERHDRVEYHQYLQWQAERQLEGVGRRSMELGLKVGLWQTLPEHVDRFGFETWFRPQLLMAADPGTCPSNCLSLDGLEQTPFETVITALRANMRFAGAIAIPLSLLDEKCSWPIGHSPEKGFCLLRPSSELLGIIALESTRNRCMVLCRHDHELPGTIRSALASFSIFSYRPGHFETTDSDDWLAIDLYPPHSAVASSDVELTSLNGFWQGKDIDLKSGASSAVQITTRERCVIDRASDRARLLVALRRQGLLPRDCDVDPSSVPRLTPDLVRATHLFLARTASKIFLLPLQDVPGPREKVAGDEERPGLPAWRRKLGSNLEDMVNDTELAGLFREFCVERGVGVVRPSASLTDRKMRLATSMPRAFYRLQLNSGFTFREAAGLVPYLDDLGISHCYLSPCLKARPNSPHGYDIVDHGMLNPELGSREDFEGFAAALDRHRMAQIIDVVPNHMAVGSDNVWWMDVLENGQSSRHAEYFDINWQSRQQELQGRVLLPILGDHYGAVLESGQLRLVFLREEGSFEVHYYEHRFPVDPQTCTRILRLDQDRLERELGARHHGFLELQNLLSSFANLPGRQEFDPEQRRTRQRNKEVLKRLLARLCRETPQVGACIEENVLRMNGEPGRPESFELLHELLDAQPYRLAFWRMAADEINYRRFFDINDLAGIRMEDPRVFEETHRLILDLVATGKVDGLRIDHPDGLYDPKHYFRKLQEALGRDDEHSQLPLYVVAEKILADFEHLPQDWPVHGTTGYDFGIAVGGLFVDPAAKREMTRCYRRFIGKFPDFDDLLYTCKKLIMTTAMAGELNVLAGQLNRLAKLNRHTRDFTLNGLRDALIEFVARFPVYRTYAGENGPARHERNYIEWAIARAKGGQGAHTISLLDFLRSVLLLQKDQDIPSPLHDAAQDFVMKLQQFTGPIMAKGMEDTAFYIANRLLSLNEVGGDPRRFGVSPAAFHNANRDRAGHYPHAMLNTSTHDSKRSGDVRCRISVLSETPLEWEKALFRWRALNQRFRCRLGDCVAPSRNDEYALYQNLIGVWPLEAMDDEALALFTERVAKFMIKAAREAKIHTNWTNPAQAYEEALLSFLHAILATKHLFLEDFIPFQQKTAWFGMLSSLSQLLLKLTAPGIPDIYQGCELWRFSLVDPDNRRPVDFLKRREALDGLREFMNVQPEERPARARQLLETMTDGRPKLYTLWRTLDLRRTHRGLFEHGSYLPLEAEGEREKHICAFMRQFDAERILVAVPRLTAGLLGREGRLPLGGEVWGNTVLPLPDHLPRAPWINIFTGAELQPETLASEGLKAEVCFKDFPVCLLFQAPEKGGHHA
ncbi:MAG: malto-oligosyltrehalose synthase [Desulfomicrobium apsheronum]|nr:malto-oligosyltrehalose synthase [Desulfomicrobium apsheronum]